MTRSGLKKSGLASKWQPWEILWCFAIGGLLFFEGLLSAEQGECNSGDFSGEDDGGGDFAEPFVELSLMLTRFLRPLLAMNQ